MPGRGSLRLPLRHRQQRRRARRLVALGTRGHLGHCGAAAPHSAAPPFRRLSTGRRRDAAVPSPARQRTARRRGTPYRPGGTKGAAGRPVGALAGEGEGTAPALPCAPAHRDGRGARSAARCCRPLSSSSAEPPATMPCTRSYATASASPTPPSAPPSARWSSAGWSRWTTTISGCSATTSGSKDWSAAWPRTTPAWSLSFAKRWRSASRRGCSRSSSPPRRCRSGSTCRPARS